MTVNVHVNESTTVKTKVSPEHSGYAVVDLSNGPDVALFFRTVADLDRFAEAISTARHELAALTEHEQHGDTANTTGELLGAGFSYASVKRFRSVLSAMFGWAVRDR